jgi:hypothetical protein
MRIFKLIGALVVVLAFSAIAVSSASAAETLWKFLPGSAGETFKGAQIGKGLLQIKGGGTIVCLKGTILLEGSALVSEGTLALATIHFSECTALGLAMNSLGDASEILLVHVEIHTCMIAPKHFGLLILPLPVHIEIPSLKLLILILEKGLFVALIESEKESKTNFLLTATQKAGVQGIEKCEGGEKESLLVKTDNEPEVAAGLEASYLVEFDLTKDKAGQTLMEK